MTTESYRKKLIEVSLPLNSINEHSRQEKSTRHGNLSSLHQWWARRPLAACRAVIFSQLVDDPSSWPEEFPTEAAQERERKRLHKIIEDMVPWRAIDDLNVWNNARLEIARTWARRSGDSLPVDSSPEFVLEYLRDHLPPICDPFCGGGSIPIEAQRLGLRAHGSDLNPVAVLISKLACEIPPRFVECPPVNPQVQIRNSPMAVSGLAADVRYYGSWLLNEARSLIGDEYSSVSITESMVRLRPDLAPYQGESLDVVAYFWARTICSPDPQCGDLMVPLVRTFRLSSHRSGRAVTIPVIDRNSRTYTFKVKVGDVSDEEWAEAKDGTKVGRGANFRCLLSGAAIPNSYVKEQSRDGKLGLRLIAIVAKSSDGENRVYIDPTPDAEDQALRVTPEWAPSQSMNERSPALVSGRGYGIRRWRDLFTHRQLLALSTFSKLLEAAHSQVLADSIAHFSNKDRASLSEGGCGATAYADAIASYLGLAIGRACDYWSRNATWIAKTQIVGHTFSMQAIPMTWDFVECNPFSGESGSWEKTAVEPIALALERLRPTRTAPAIIQHDAASTTPLISGAIVATDPPYYDNIDYADLSDYFYVWHRQNLQGIWPDLFRRLVVPKDEELVASTHRHGDEASAAQFFLDGMKSALTNIHNASTNDFPITIYYAFRQVQQENSLTSPGWATFLQAIVDVGYVICGTWPLRTERQGRMIQIGTNAMASSILLVCRRRSATAKAVTRREFLTQLRKQLPDAIKEIQAAGISPVDMAQAALGPGMGVFSTFSAVLENDDTKMPVRTAIEIINQVRDEVSGGESSSFDSTTRFCIDWFREFGWSTGDAGVAIGMALPYNVDIVELERAGVLHSHRGRSRLVSREELVVNVDSSSSDRLTNWECAQHLAKVLRGTGGSIDDAGLMLQALGDVTAEGTRMLAYRLFEISEQRGMTDEARVWNELVQEWPTLLELSRAGSLTLPS